MHVLDNVMMIVDLVMVNDIDHDHHCVNCNDPDLGYDLDYDHVLVNVDFVVCIV